MAMTSAISESQASTSGSQQALQQDGGVQGAFAGEISNLMAARRAGGDDHGAGRLAAHGGEQPSLADGPGHVIVAAIVAEGAGHPAATGVEIDDRGPGNRQQQRL